MFSKDFINDRRGAPYPLRKKDASCQETVAEHQYRVSGGRVQRMFTRFFPYACYELSFQRLQGSCGFVISLVDEKASLVCTPTKIWFSDGLCEQTAELPHPLSQGTLIVSCRPGAFDIYLAKNQNPGYLTTFQSQAFYKSNEKKRFEQGYVCLACDGEVAVDSVCSYLDCGISQADIRAVCYENAQPIFENGTIFFTASIRMQEGGFQGIFSWTPSTSAIELTGALFFDRGDGFWRNYLASSLVYNRKTQEWYLWTSSFEDQHILCYAAFQGEPRFGLNVIDVQMMPQASTDNAKEFAGFPGDEDPDFYFDESQNRWILAICRLSPKTKQYQYLFFQSSHPFHGYRFLGQGKEGAETGGAFVNLKGNMAFICGNDFKKRSNYRIYTQEGMQEASFDFDDGGFRGWGSVIPLSMGSRQRYFWLTFDRHNGSSYPWSYGNLYCFELFS